MNISEQERQAIILVLNAGEKFGYGNLISHLQTAWAKRLLSEGLDEVTARKHSGGEGYPYKMQDDLINRGMWDETGRSYRNP